MTRPLLALAVGLLTAAAALANAAAPPPPGKKFVRVDHTITTDRPYPDLDFYLATGFTAKKVEFGPDEPVKVEGNRGGPAYQVRFVAVPKGAAGKYPRHTAFVEALGTGVVPGQVTTERLLDVRVAVDVTDPRSVVVETHAVEKIDPKAGIVLRAAKTSAPAPRPGGDKNAAGEGSGPLSAAAPAARGGAVVAALAAALALAFAGLWLARRSRP